jgi:hypothetical protein
MMAYLKISMRECVGCTGNVAFQNMTEISRAAHHAPAVAVDVSFRRPADHRARRREVAVEISAATTSHFPFKLVDIIRRWGAYEAGKRHAEEVGPRQTPRQKLAGNGIGGH